MGGNQAMRDTHDIMQAIESLHKKAQVTALTSADFTSAVQEYEGKMIPRAFGWVRASGGLDTDVSFPMADFASFSQLTRSRACPMQIPGKDTLSSSSLRERWTWCICIPPFVVL